jgi:hypothetical protein
VKIHFFIHINEKDSNDLSDEKNITMSIESDGQSSSEEELDIYNYSRDYTNHLSSSVGGIGCKKVQDFYNFWGCLGYIFLLLTFFDIFDIFDIFFRFFDIFDFLSLLIDFFLTFCWRFNFLIFF